MAKIKVRVLVDCAFGQCNDVVEVDEAELKAAEKAGTLDGDKAAVAYAAKLPQNQPKPKDEPAQ